MRNDASQREQKSAGSVKRQSRLRRRDGGKCTHLMPKIPKERWQAIRKTDYTTTTNPTPQEEVGKRGKGLDKPRRWKLLGISR